MNSELENIIDHYKNPRNVLDKTQVKDYFLTTESSNLSCGDRCRFVLIPSDGKHKVLHDSEGCSLTIAAASILSEMFNNNEMDKKKMLSLDFDSFVESLGVQITFSRRKCIYVAFEAFKKLIQQLHH
ncbi:iron-sulfur cluster assembly scaffold protein [Candidatus Dojkabacteria bacterium]|uniref:Iron-sulfur cluster assembly scaffold protein n=1 Tax=Candidatus Dojkabacteria bacterium TaxID=2099670 RepID=A0A3M0Z105_9BACT|nr:MAG: iron-sulfur cluster assembly scaffold protein [Candidatus Dojkabacteria bacterium]